jgi:hypothetical protein
MAESFSFSFYRGSEFFLFFNCGGGVYTSRAAVAKTIGHTVFSFLVGPKDDLNTHS